MRMIIGDLTMTGTDRSKSRWKQKKTTSQEEEEALQN